jgi:hypothetical protein
MTVNKLSQVAEGVKDLTGGADGTDAVVTLPGGSGEAPIASPPTVSVIPPEFLASFNAMQTQLAELNAAQQKRDQEARDAEIKQAQLKGDHETALALARKDSETKIEAERQRASAIAAKAKKSALDAELSTALAGYEFMPGGHDQVKKLVREDFVVDEQGETFVARSRDGQPVGQYLGALLGRQEYSHFLKAQHRGGTASSDKTQTRPTPPANPTPDVEPRNMSEAVLMTMAARKKSEDDPRLTPTLGMGLRPLAR